MEKSTDLEFMLKIGFDPKIAEKAAELLSSMDEKMRMMFWLRFVDELEKELNKTGE